MLPLLINHYRHMLAKEQNYIIFEYVLQKLFIHRIFLIVLHLISRIPAEARYVSIETRFYI